MSYDGAINGFARYAAQGSCVLPQSSALPQFSRLRVDPSPDISITRSVGEPVMKIAKEKLPGVKFDTPWTEKEGDKAFDEVRGKYSDGKTRDIEVASDSTVMGVD